jgi:excinuclease UvrABC ATPase subunit
MRQKEAALPENHGMIEVSRTCSQPEESGCAHSQKQLVVITGIIWLRVNPRSLSTPFCRRPARYMESFAAYARQFMGDLDRPDVDKVSGLSPVIFH